MGFHVVAVGRGSATGADTVALGAHTYIDSEQNDPGSALRQMGSAQAILTTVSDPDAVAALMTGLAPQGRLVLLAASKDPLRVVTGQMVRGERSVVGSLTGTAYRIEKTLSSACCPE